MSITIGFLYAQSRQIYGMKCLAGMQGFDRKVSWIHIIENKESASFLHGGELVFCTGVTYTHEEWMLDYVNKLHKSGASGLVINIGPYIRCVPKGVAAFCEHKGFPLFIIPWSVRLVDITRYLCRFIIEEEKKEQQVSQYLRFILMNPERCEEACRALRACGFAADGVFRVLTARIMETEASIESAAAMAEEWEAHVPLFVYNDGLIRIVCENEEGQTAKWVKGWHDWFQLKGLEARIGVGAAVSPVGRISESYQQAAAMLRLSSSQQPVVTYDDAGVYKLLVGGPSAAVMQQFYEDTLGALEEYDRTHHSDLMKTLAYYMAHRCSIKETAAHEVVHRNTVLYKLNKIETITGKKLNEEDEKIDIVMALKIKKFLSMP